MLTYPFSPIWANQSQYFGPIKPIFSNFCIKIKVSLFFFKKIFFSEFLEFFWVFCEFLKNFSYENCDWSRKWCEDKKLFYLQQIFFFLKLSHFYTHRWLCEFSAMRKGKKFHCSLARIGASGKLKETRAWPVQKLKSL